jgi:hypothetical protein
VGPDDLGALLVDVQENNYRLLGIACVPGEADIANPAVPYYGRYSTFLRISMMDEALLLDATTRPLQAGYVNLEGRLLFPLQQEEQISATTTTTIPSEASKESSEATEMEQEVVSSEEIDSEEMNQEEINQGLLEDPFHEDSDTQPMEEGSEGRV